MLFRGSHHCPSSGESGIRTHAPLRTNGFQDRLVMTTSIPLHIYFMQLKVAVLVSDLFILTKSSDIVNRFFEFFLKFFIQISMRFLDPPASLFLCFHNCPGPSLIVPLYIVLRALYHPLFCSLHHLTLQTKLHKPQLN